MDTVRYRQIQTDMLIRQLQIFLKIWFNHLSNFVKLTENLNYLSVSASSYMHPSLTTCICLYSPLATSLLLDLCWFAWICLDLPRPGKIQANPGKSRHIQANPSKYSNRLVAKGEYRQIQINIHLYSPLANTLLQNLPWFAWIYVDLSGFAWICMDFPGFAWSRQIQANPFKSRQIKVNLATGY